MRIKPEFGSVVGQIDDMHWGQVLLLHNAYGVIEIEDTEGLARRQGVVVLNKLTHRLSSNVTSLKELSEIADEVIESQVKSIILVLPVGNILYIVLRGSGVVYLKRDRLLATLIDKPGGISGEVAQGDTLLAVSHGITRALQPDEVTGVFDHLEAQEVAEKLTLLLHAKDNGRGAAALVFQISSFLPIEAEESEQEATSIAQVESFTKPNSHDGVARAPEPSFFIRLKNALRTRRLPHRSKVGHVIAVLGSIVPTRERSGRKFLTIAILIFVGLFGISVVLGIQKQASNAKNRELMKVLDEAQRNFDEGVALMTLNPVTGRARLKQAQSALKPLVDTVSDRTREGRQLIALYGKVVENLTLAMQIVPVVPKLFYDVSLLKKDARISAVSLLGETLSIVDQAGRTVYELDLPSKSGQILAGGQEYEGVSFAATGGGKVYTLVDKGIHSIRLSDKKTVTTVIKKNDKWGSIVSMVSYGGNIYLLDREKSRIWKYISTEGGFSELLDYLNADYFTDFSRATNMAIDGSVWVATSDGKILRFTQGKENPVVLAGVEPTLGMNLLVYTSDSAKHVYILDTQNKRVVVVDKDGVYVAQYVWDQALTVTDLVVSESQSKILLVADGKLYSIDLK